MPIDRNGDQIAALTRPFHIQLLRLAHADANATLGLDAEFSLESVEVQRTLKMLATKVRSVADTTREDIRRLTGQGAEEGWGPSRLADEIAKLGEIASITRAELIAVTEAATGYSQGSLIRYKESGQVRGTEWLVTDPCPICEPLAGKVASLGEVFADGIDAPPAHPRCRCALAPVLT
jgi:SPP1 gp7 family putative phage head morphogenesis protein